jgi:RimJ/RimL family protein N-acetyltransferase
LREFSQDDLDDLAAIVADEEQMSFYPRPRTRDEASAWISRNLTLYKECGFGVWFIESLLTSAFLGYCGIRPLALEGVADHGYRPLLRRDLRERAFLDGPAQARGRTWTSGRAASPGAGFYSVRCSADPAA